MKDTLETEMLNKSQEAFLLAIEIYNKPTIQYRLECFAYLICNAWELLLKAYIIKNLGKENIYYKDKPDRTISLSDSIKLVFTNDKDPIRKNLEIISDLRNTSTHFIIQELEDVYLPFAQANTINYSQKLYDMFGIDITNNIKTSFLSLIANPNEVNDSEILSKYGENIFKRYINLKDKVTTLLETESNSKLAINVDLNLQVVKSQKDAHLNFSITKDADKAILIMNKIKDINIIYPYSQTNARETIMKNLQRFNLNLNLHQKNFKLICDKYDLKNNPDFFYYHTLTDRYCCSQKLIDFVTTLITKQPDIIDKLKEELKK